MAGPIAPFKVLVVDDSALMRSCLRSALKRFEDFDVCGVAGDGRTALGLVLAQKPDLVILDLEMPDMRGEDFLIELTARAQTSDVLIFSGSKDVSAQQRAKRLAKNVCDFVAKPSSSEGAGGEGDAGDPVGRIHAALRPALQAFITRRRAPIQRPARVDAPADFQPDAIVIASSTGGPPALDRLLANFPSAPLMPIFLVQHMPPVFTAQLADRLQRVSGFPCREVSHEMDVKPGCLYVAPGGFHMIVKRHADRTVKAVINVDPPLHFVRPAADHLFESAAKVYPGAVLGLVLTGMGVDGANGAKTIAEGGGRVWIQDQESSAVWSMPKAVRDLRVQEFTGSPEALRAKLISISTTPSGARSLNHAS